MQPIRGRFDQRLNELSQDIARLGSLTDEAIEQSTRALSARDVALARQIGENDRVINAMRYQIEEQAYALLATQQPMARDLRQIASVISIVTDIERMADHAAGIARLVVRMGDELPTETPTAIFQMAEVGRRMLHQSLDAYLASDAVLARAVAEQDDEMDDLYAQVSKQLFDQMVADPSSIACSSYQLWVAHNLERIGDRTTNICERTIYVATGQLTDLDDLQDEADPYYDRV